MKNRATDTKIKAREGTVRFVRESGHERKKKEKGKDIVVRGVRK